MKYSDTEDVLYEEMYRDTDEALAGAESNVTDDRLSLLDKVKYRVSKLDVF
jgi:hypothetical protein